MGAINKETLKYEYPILLEIIILQENEQHSNISQKRIEEILETKKKN
jgi:hypothetical protein